VFEIRLLGPFEVRDGDRVLTPRRQKQRALLAALALRAGEVVSMDRLVDELWGESSPKTAKHALENYVSELRKTLGKDVIETRPSGYVLRVEPGQIDVRRFDELVALARGRDAVERSRILGDALSLVRGEPLADLAFEPFAQREVVRLKELELSAREELLGAELELGRHRDVVPALELLVADHPFRERLRAQLMLALYRSGRQAEALAAYQDARHVLVEELGIDPNVELQELERQILRQDSDLQAPPSPPAEPTTSLASAQPSRRQARKTITVVFTELANARTLAEELDPELLRAVLDRYLDIARAAVKRHGGSCVAVRGDELLAAFGVPTTHEDDAIRGVRAAVELREGVGVLNDGLLPEHGLYLEVRTAVNTGEVLVGPDDEDLTGRAVTVAEQLARETAKPGQILLGGQTYDFVSAVVEIEELALAGSTRVFRLAELLPDTYGRTLRLDSPLVGRRRQLSALSAAVESAVLERTFHLFTVLGSAGVGKSRLVREFIESIGDVASVLQGRCLPYGEGITYWPLIEALRDGGVVDGVAPIDAAEPSAALVQAQLERLAREHPLVLVIDDLHWAESALLDLIEGVAESSRGVPILTVCIARPELLDDRPSWGGGKPNANSILLEPLSAAESERLVDNLLGESDLADPVRDHIISAAEGNPLFVEELLATLVDSDVLRRESGRWTTTTVTAVPFPPTLLALISARIDRLPEAERTVLELASVEGHRDFHRGVAAELAPEELRADIDVHLLALVRKEVVRPTAAGDGGYSFRHQLIRDAAYESMPLQVRAMLHDRIADVIERAAPRGAEPDLSEHHRKQAQKYRAVLSQA
jgi:DNA-binding SARP family transcriptional activator